MGSIAIAGDRMAHFADRRAAGAEGQRPLDEAGFERFHRRTSQALWGYLRRLTGDPATADDVHQESYLRYLARPPEGGQAEAAGDERRRSAYLFRIATNLVHDRWRREQRERGWLRQFLAPEPVPETPLSLDFEAVFRQLKPRQRALLWLAHVEGYRHGEIAEILELKAGSVKVLLFRARRRLAELVRAAGLEPASSTMEGTPP